jgi:hypothetical protein
VSDDDRVVRSPDPEAVAALDPLLRSGGLGRYRVLDVICQRDHRLLQVLSAGGRLLVLAECSAGRRWTETFGGDSIPVWDPDDEIGWIDRDWSIDVERRETRSRAGYVVAFLEQPTAADPVYEAQCRCRTAHISAQWLRSALTGSDRRRRRVAPLRPASVMRR